jgi:uroporphyrinogen decarboxylase
MRQAGRYLPEYHIARKSAGGMLGLCRSPEHAAEVTLQPIRRFHLDAAILFADLPQIAAALGPTLEYREDEGPVLYPSIRSTGDIQRHLSLSRLHEELAPVYETVRLLSTALPSNVGLIGYAGAPWTIATYMVEGRGSASSDHAAIKQWAFSDPDGFEALIDLLTTAVIQYLERQIDAGAEALQLFESWAGILPEPFFGRWCVAPVTKIIKALRMKSGEIPIIVFPRGAGLLYEGFIQATEADCIGLDNTVPLGWASKSIQRELGRCIQGNLDPQMLLVGGDRMKAEVERILEATCQGPFVFNLGHGVLKTTPPDHVSVLVNQVQDWRS